MQPRKRRLLNALGPGGDDLYQLWVEEGTGNYILVDLDNPEREIMILQSAFRPFVEMLQSSVGERY